MNWIVVHNLPILIELCTSIKIPMIETDEKNYFYGYFFYLFDWNNGLNKTGVHLFLKLYDSWLILT